MRWHLGNVIMKAAGAAYAPVRDDVSSKIDCIAALLNAVTVLLAVPEQKPVEVTNWIIV